MLLVLLILLLYYLLPLAETVFLRTFSEKGHEQVLKNDAHRKKLEHIEISHVQH